KNISVFAPGDTIEVQWNEYINHPGHFRIAFDESGNNSFQDPVCLDNCDNRSMVIEQQAGDPSVLLDAIPDTPSGGLSSVSVTLPDIECDDCTLQVIQVMTDKPPYTIGGDDLYYQCADIVLTSSAIYSNSNQILKMPIVLVDEDPLYNVRLQLDNQNRYSLLDYSTTMELREGQESPVANAAYSTESRVLTIVQLQVGDEIFYDVRLLLKMDGIFELLGFSNTPP
ncbi:MAG: lytic polysaccharide monooxygenase, partial [Proteobacteria bacterium]|nr:lytic polysaccharide monooxygenase [Pseudomonadota bacterium]